MDKINLWESSFAKYYSFSNDLDVLLDLIRKGKIITVKDKFSPGDDIDNVLDCKAAEANIFLIMTDEQHSIAITDKSFISSIMINKSFFEKHKDAIFNEMIKYVLESKDPYVVVDKQIFSAELFEKLLAIKGRRYDFVNIDLTKEQIKQLNDNFIVARILKRNNITKVSTDRVIGTYSMKELNENQKIYIKYDLNEHDFENLKYVNDQADIIISSGEYSYNLDGHPTATEEENYYRGAKKIIDQLESLGKKNMVSLLVNKRSLFAKYSYDCQSIKLILISDANDYTYSAYKKEEEKLAKLVENIKNSPMSPFEKYLAVYNIVKNYKPYKENEKDKDQARDLKYILDGEYMVCVGFSKLLITLLDKVGINAIIYGTWVRKYEEGKQIISSGHARVMVNLEDPKYGINGYYIADPTWDNGMGKDYYNYAAVSYDSMQKSHYAMDLTNLDLIFDVHSFEDYCEKINVFLNIEYRRNQNSGLKEKNNIITMYRFVCDKIMTVLSQIDLAAHDSLKETYDNAKANPSGNNFNMFLTMAGNIIVAKSNKQISNETIINAALISKNQSDDIETIREKLLEEKVRIDQNEFPNEIFEGAVSVQTLG